MSMATASLVGMAMATLAEIFAANPWMAQRGRDFGPGAVAQYFPATTEGGPDGWYVGDVSNQIQNYDPRTQTYVVARSTPRGTQAYQRYNLRGEPVEEPMEARYGPSGTLSDMYRAPYTSDGGYPMGTSTSDFFDGGLGLMLAASGVSAGAGMAGLGGAAEAAAPFGGFDAGAVSGANYAGAPGAFQVAQAGGGTMTDVSGGLFSPEEAARLNMLDADMGVAGADTSFGNQFAPQGINVPGYGSVYGGQFATGPLRDALQATAAGRALFQGNGGGRNEPGSSVSNTDRVARIFRGDGRLEDFLSVGGAAAPGILGAVASNQQANTVRDLATQARNDRLPFLNAATGWLNNPDSYISGPGQTGLRGVLNALSVQGNPLENPNALATATEAGMRDWRNAVQGVGALGLGGDNLQANLGLNAANADANVWGGLGGAAADVFNPPKTLDEIVRALRPLRVP